MGAKESRPGYLSYEDAAKRVSESEARRLREAHRRAAGGGPGAPLPPAAFCQLVLSGSAPPHLADRLYAACGGTRRGLAFKDLLCGLVLLTKGTQEERIKFLWSLYCNETGTHILKSDFIDAIRSEKRSLSAWKTSQINTNMHMVTTTLFGGQSEKINFETFRSWVLMHKNATIFSYWLLLEPTVNLTSELETPTFYQSLAGVTHLEERDICLLEKYFWRLLNNSATGQLDAVSLGPLLSPPVPKAVLNGLLLALDENRDGHVDFKELCCGLSAACRGPILERVKFCFKIFDADRDGILNKSELLHMINILCFVANESLYNTIDSSNFEKIKYDPDTVYESLKDMMTSKSNNSVNRKRSKDITTKYTNGNSTDIFSANSIVSSEYNSSINVKGDSCDCLAIDNPEGNSKNGHSDKTEIEEWELSQENFLIWHVDKGNSLVAPFLQLIFQVCHIVLGLRPQCKHQEQEIVLGWLSREVRRGYSVGQFWYLISSEWWASWLRYTGRFVASGNDKTETCCSCKATPQRPYPLIDEAIVCDENFNNSAEWMADNLGHSETGSLGSSSSSSGVSCNGGSHISRPGPIDNSSLLATNPYNVPTLTGEGGHLKRDLTLSQHRDFELVPDSLWKALSQWYGGPKPLPRQVIQPPKSGVELELYPRNLRLMKHMANNHQQVPSTSSWSGMVGGYGAAALSTVGAASYQPLVSMPRRYLAYTAAFSRLATIKQVCEFICSQLKLSREDVRLWIVEDSKLNPEEDGMLILLEDEMITLMQLGVMDGQKLLIEIRNKDLTWPEEMGALGKSAMVAGNKRNTLMNITPGAAPHPAGATGLQNLGNTCFMNAALQAVWNTGPLTWYFTRDMHLYELNVKNPLGTRGALAQRYGELCKEVWNSGARSVAPLRVRLCVYQNADQFSGGGQHDSQELLAWLLDALHEDLNRVIKGPYTELRDSDGRPDHIVAQEAWDQHAARNHSVITELFYGQLKSKVTCIKCNQESVRFDPFNMLSLPLPMESYILIEIQVILLNGSVPIKYGLRLNSEGYFSDLRDSLASLCNVNARNLLLAEVNGPQIVRLPSLQNRLRSAPGVINLYAYELPNHSFDPNVSHACSLQEEKMTEGDACGMETDVSADVEQLSSSSEPNNKLKKAKKNLTIESYLPNDNDESIPNVDYSPKKEYSREILSNANIDIDFKSKFDSPNKTKNVDTKMEININNSIPNINYSTKEMNSYEDILRPCYLIAIHRKLCRQDTYFLSQHKNKYELFGMPLLIPIFEGCSSKQLYTQVWTQVERLLSVPPITPPDQSNHATDCDDSLGYTFPFTLRLVNRGGIKCAVCPWTRFCKGCTIPCEDEPYVRNLVENISTSQPDTVLNKQNILSNENTKRTPSASPKLQNKFSSDTINPNCILYDSQLNYLDFKQPEENLKFTSQMDNNTLFDIHIAIDWDPTALHLRYQSTRERMSIDHPSVSESRASHAAAVQLKHCLNAFTSEEQLEERYSCSKCKSSQPATKKLQIWRLPPILVIHLKRFQYVNNKWIKSQKVVDFPYNDFDPTAYLASIPQETILRHAELKQLRRKKSANSGDCDQVIENDEDEISEDCESVFDQYKTEKRDFQIENVENSIETKMSEIAPKVSEENAAKTVGSEKRKSSIYISNRRRLESTSLTKTPIVDDSFVDYHQHKLKENEDPFNLKYRLYAVVSHSGMMNGGHYVSYAHNPNGAWYCYNDSSCKELTPPTHEVKNSNITPAIDPSSAYMLFYERVGLDYETYLPNVSDKCPVLSETELADGEDSDFKKMCRIS